MVATVEDPACRLPADVSVWHLANTKRMLSQVHSLYCWSGWAQSVDKAGTPVVECADPDMRCSFFVGMPCTIKVNKTLFSLNPSDF